MLEAPKTFYGTADAHTRRVTLNLIRASTVCPDDLAFIVDDLAASRWDWAKLTQADAEAIYGLVNDDLVERAKAEFSADTTTVVDMDRHYADHPEFVDEDGDTFCPLCGHKHVRWGFTLRNLANPRPDAREGSSLLTGSTCVVQYGLRVDGSTTAEAALAALNKAIAGLQRKAEREDWQAAHPDHVQDMATLAKAEQYIGPDWMRVIPWSARAELPRPWGSRNSAHHNLGKWLRATLKFYRANRFLTAARSEQCYESGALATATDIVAQVDAALASDPVAAYWRDWLDRHPMLTPSERRMVEEIVAYGYTRSALYSWRITAIEAVEARHASLPPPPPLPGDAPAAVKKPTVTRDDVSDLPGMV